MNHPAYDMKKITYKRKANYEKIIASKTYKSEGKVVDGGEGSSIICADYATTNSAISLLNPVQEGTGQYQRVGRHIKLKSIKFRFRLSPRGIVNGGGDVIRIAVVYDRQSSAALVLPNYNTMFQNRAPGGGTSSNVYSQINSDNTDRFILLKDTTWQTPPVFASSAWNAVTPCKLGGSDGNMMEMYLNLEGLDTHYRGTANPLTIEYITTGALYLVVQGIYDQSVAAWELHATRRLRYTDC